MGFAIQEELSGHYPFLSFYERSQKYGILEKLDELARCPRVSRMFSPKNKIYLFSFKSTGQLEAHRDFVLWTIKLYKELQAKQAPSDGGAESSGLQQSAGEEQPLSLEEQARQEKEVRARLAAERRAMIMAQMQSAQKSFMKSNAEMFAATDKESREDTAATGAMDWEDISDEDEQGAVALKPNVACLGPDRKFYQGSEADFKCILCFENCAISRSGPPLVSSAFVQTSRVILTTPNMRASQSALHMSCCGHVMHHSCWQEYYSNEESKEQRRPHRNRAALSQANNVEFHCPYCRTLSNTVLPVTEALPAFSPPPSSTDSYLPLDSFVEIMLALAADLRAIEDEEMCQLPSVSSILRKSGVVADMAQFAC